jgi:LysM repeat protein
MATGTTSNTEQRLEELKNKYASVLNLIQQQGVRLSHVHVQDNKLFVQGAAPSEDAKNRVWDQIKLVNPNYDDITADITVDAGAAPQAQQSSSSNPMGEVYEVKSGDSLSKIAKQFYGDANRYMDIFNANKDKLSDPNKIQPGQKLVIPAK